MILGRMKITQKCCTFFISRLFVIAFITLYSILSSFIGFPEFINAIVGAIFIIIIPFLLGHLIFSFDICKLSASDLDFMSRFTIFWSTGSILILFLTNVVWTIGKNNLKIVLILIAVLILLDSLRCIYAHRLNSCVRRLYEKHTLLNFLIFLSILANGLSPVLLFRFYQPFPTFLTSEFSYFGRAVQLIDGSPYYSVAEQAAYPIISVLLGIGTIISNAHPLPLIWIFAFVQSIIVAGAIFFLARVLFKRIFPSLLSSFFAMWVFGIGSTHNNPYVVTNGTLQYAFYVLALYVITQNLRRNKNLFKKRKWLIILGVPLLIILQRVVWGYWSIPATLVTLSLPFIFLLYYRKEFMNNKGRFFLTLFIIFVFMAIIHPYMAPIYIFDMVVYIWLWKFLENRSKLNLSIALVFIVGSLMFYLLQASNILTFPDHFTLSKYLFGDRYKNVPGINFGFADKVRCFTQGNTNLVIIFFILGAILLVLKSVIYKKCLPYLLVVTVSALTFTIYFFPEAWFVRARHMIPFFVLTLGGGADVMISLLNDFLRRVRIKIKDVKNTILHVRPEFLSIVLVILIFLPVAYDSTFPFRNRLNPCATSNKCFITFEQYEYKAAKWLRDLIPYNERYNTLIISDPYTTNLMTALGGFRSPYKKAWIIPEEYSTRDLQLMEDIRSIFFKSSNMNDRWKFLEKLFNETNMSSAIIIVNGRTTKWLFTNRTFVLSSFGIPWHVEDAYIRAFSTTFTTPLYFIEDKLYIYKVDLSDIPDFLKGVTEVIVDDKFEDHLWIKEADGNGTISAPSLSEDFYTKIYKGRYG